MKKLFSILIITVFVFSTCFGQLPSQEEIAKIDSLLNSTYKVDEPGGIVAIAKNGKTIYSRAFGLANIELNVPNNSESVIQIGSITKQFTAVAILKLYEEGKLSIYDKITKYFPETSDYWDDVEIEHLLTHTSGIINLFEIPDWMSAWTTEYTPNELLSFFKDKELLFQPGEQHNYSNSGYVLLGLIIEKASGMSYQEYLQKEIFEPNSMSQSYVADETSIIPNRSNGYQVTSSDFMNPNFINPSHYYAGGSILTSTIDLVKWSNAFLNGVIINDSLVKKATSSYILNDGNKANYGYGFTTGKKFDRKMIQHGGSTIGSNTHDLWFPDDSLYIIVLNNSIAFPGSGIEEKYNSRKTAHLLASICFHKSIEKPKNVELSKEDFEYYQGVYEDSKGKPRYIYRRDDKMFWTNSTGRRFEIYYLGNDTFGYKDNDNNLTFKKSGEKIIEAVLIIGDDKHYYNRTNLSLPDPKKRKDIPVELYEKIVGKYSIGVVFKVKISKGDNAIIVDATGQEPTTFYLENDLKFYKDDEENVTIEFTKDNKENIIGFVMNFADNQMKAKKKV